MSELILKSEIHKIINEYYLDQNPKIVCSVVKVLKMKHKNLDISKACKIAKEILK